MVEHSQKNTQFQLSGVTARQWEWEPVLINVEFIYNLIFFVFQSKIPEKDNSETDFKFLLSTLKN